jgi:8-oxo-dGTP diphosphatase
MEQRYKLKAILYNLFIKDNQILLLKRIHSDFHDKIFSLPAGHLDPGESLKRAAVREAKEEVDLDVNEDDLELVHVIHIIEGNSPAIGFYFKVKNFSGEPKNMEPDKHDLVGWYDLDNLPKNITPVLRTALQKILKGDNYSEINFN